jgi:carbamoyltransferase
MVVLGINAYHAGASAAIVVDGQLVAAAEEERFTRVRHDTSFPLESVRYCLDAANVLPREIDHIALARNSWAGLGQRVAFATGIRAGRRIGLSRASNIGRLVRSERTLADGLGVPRGELRARAHLVGHHRAHVASSFLVSPFERAAVMSVDGCGDMLSGIWGLGEGGHVAVMGEVPFPHSLGVFYTALTQYLGFPRYGDEHKVMALAAFGEPAHLDEMRRAVRAGGMGYRLDLAYFRHQRAGPSATCDGGPPAVERLWSRHLANRLGPARSGESLERRHYEIASSLQRRLEEVLLGMLTELHARTGVDALCLAGGVALNAVVNGRILTETPFRRLYVQPAANDAGTSVGAAFRVHHDVADRPREFVMEHAYYGPEFNAERCCRALAAASLPFQALDDQELVERTATALAAGRIVGWFQGRMEFGPRALGNRSILADPRRPYVMHVLNDRIEHRDSFLPFAPSILHEATGRYFEQSHPSPFMNHSYRVRPVRRPDVVAATHVDGTGQVQTVRRDQNPRYHALLTAFERRTGVPVLLNTSFDDDQPICCAPEEAVATFCRTRMDVLVLGNLYAEKR